MKNSTRIFFDVDGVLIKGFFEDEVIRNNWHKFVTEALKIDSHQFQKEFFLGSFNDVVIGKKDLHEALSETFKKMGIHGDTQTFIDFWLGNDSALDKDVMRVVKALQQQGTELYIATNQEKNRACYLWENLNLKEHFKDIFYSGEIGCLKKDPAFFHHINERLNIQKSDTVLFFDDSLDNIETSNKEGWNAIHYRNITDILEHHTVKGILA